MGRMADATRDNFERTQFVGYDPRVVRYWQFILSGFFAGIAGRDARLPGLRDRHLRHAGRGEVGQCAARRLYRQGQPGFFGPILGAIVVVGMQSGISLFTSAWLLYLGVLFIAMVMFAPGGLLGLMAKQHRPIARMGRMGELAVPCTSDTCPRRAGDGRVRAVRGARPTAPSARPRAERVQLGLSEMD